MAPFCKKSNRNEIANTHEPSENKGQFHFKSTVKEQPHFDFCVLNVVETTLQEDEETGETWRF